MLRINSRSPWRSWSSARSQSSFADTFRTAATRTGASTSSSSTTTKIFVGRFKISRQFWICFKMCCAEYPALGLTPFYFFVFSHSFGVKLSWRNKEMSFERLSLILLHTGLLGSSWSLKFLRLLSYLCLTLGCIRKGLKSWSIECLMCISGANLKLKKNFLLPGSWQRNFIEFWGPLHSTEATHWGYKKQFCYGYCILNFLLWVDTQSYWGRWFCFEKDCSAPWW